MMKYAFTPPPPEVGEGQGDTRTYKKTDIHIYGPKRIDRQTLGNRDHTSNRIGI